MDPDTDKLQPERKHTDQSLRVERKNIDRALQRKRAIVEQAADDRVEHAREQADAVLDKARSEADEVIETGEPGAAATVVARAREQADLLLQTERDNADKKLQQSREDEAAALAKLLPLEREKTDRFLLTERQRSDNALAHRDDFLGMVSHDLRNLLHGIVLHSNLLLTRASDSAEGQRTVEGMQQIQRYVARMNRLIGDLVDIASLDAGRLALHPEVGDAAALLAEAVDAYADAAAEKQLVLRTEVIDQPLMAEFDHERLLQVLSNLLSNAIKFTPAGGEINVRGECSERELLVAVRDTGQGIPADKLEAIFERFWQVGKNDSRGLGLGLYISRCIVEAHGGSIWADSTQGEGSVLRLKLPRRPTSV